MRLGILIALAVIVLVLASCKGAPPTSPGVIAKEPTRLYWGDTHLHTSYSADAYFLKNRSAGPDTAYRWAQGVSGRASVDAITRADPHPARFPRRGRPRRDVGGSGQADAGRPRANRNRDRDGGG